MRFVITSCLVAQLVVNALHAQPGPGLDLEVATNRRYYQADARNRVHIDAQIKAVGGTEGTQPAAIRNLALVLDRSGSMAGKPVQLLRQAVAATLRTLSGEDIVSVVVFGSEVETLIEARPCSRLDDLDRLLERIEPVGGAALFDALNQGAAQLRRYATPTTVNHLVLITDGPPTKGPRETADFSKLVEVFGLEGFTLSTIGLGPDFNEDMLATMARIGNGAFRYADQPEKLAEALQREVAPLRTVVARDAVLTVEFAGDCSDLTASGWQPAAIKGDTISYRFPRLYADQLPHLLASALMSERRFPRQAATVRLRWREPTGEKEREIVKPVPLEFETDLTTVRESDNAAVIRTVAGILISEGMQEAIELIDKGDFRRALRALRRTQNEATGLNDDLEDAAISAVIRPFETYLAEVQKRGLNLQDRKILRSGLFGRFETPVAEDAGKK